MRRFKPGQKVVYDPKGGYINPESNQPKAGSIVLIKQLSDVYLDSYILYGYELSKDGRSQHCPDEYLHPIVETRERITYKLSAPCPPELLNPNQLIELEQPQKI